MSEESPIAASRDALLRLRALSRWETEGGASPGGRETTPLRGDAQTASPQDGPKLRRRPFKSALPL